LSFDQYQGDQVLVLDAGEEEGQRHSGMQIIDQPDVPMSQVTEALELPEGERQARLREIYSGKNKSKQRAYLGRMPDRSSALELKDPEGRNRIVMTVAADGSPSLRFLDEQGKVIAQFPKEAR
jgi:hypothetical protein